MLTRHYRELLNFLAGRVADRATAADLVQESFARVLAAQQAGQVIADPRALLFSAARHLVIDAARHRRVVDAWAEQQTALNEQRLRATSAR